MRSLKEINRTIVACRQCPRLIPYCQEIAKKKKREFQNDTYWGKPVPAFGDPNAQLWILGLAPAAHGANRTGRMFTGDSSGRWVFGALHKYGFSSHKESLWHNDKLKLTDVYISAVLRCAPPQNKPLREEIQICEKYLDLEFQQLKKLKLILVTGAIAFKAACRLLQRQHIALPKGMKFSHGAYYDMEKVALMATYHPSRQNTNTGRLTLPMWHSIFQRCPSTSRPKR